MKFLKNLILSLLLLASVVPSQLCSGGVHIYRSIGYQEAAVVGFLTTLLCGVAGGACLGNRFLGEDSKFGRFFAPVLGGVVVLPCAGIASAGAIVAKEFTEGSFRRLAAYIRSLKKSSKSESDKRAPVSFICDKGEAVAVVGFLTTLLCGVAGGACLGSHFLAQDPKFGRFGAPALGGVVGGIVTFPFAGLALVGGFLSMAVWL